MPLLNRKKQFASELESVAGTYESDLLSDSAHYDILALEPSVGFELDTFDREYARDTITATKALVGRKTVTYSLQCEVNGFGSANSGTTLPSEPGWAKFLRAASMRSVETSAFDIPLAGRTVAGGPFRHGETVTMVFGTPSSSGSAVLLHDHFDGQRFMTFEKGTYVAPTGSADLTITGDSSGATLTFTEGGTDVDDETVTSAGYTYVPVSTSRKTVAMSAALGTTPDAGDILEERTVGGVPTGVRIKYVSQDTGSPFTLTFEYIRGGTLTGTNVFYNLTKRATAGSETITGSTEAYLYGEALSLGLNEDGVAITGAGCRTNVSWIFEANRPTKMQFDARGSYNSVGDEAFNASTSEDLTNPPLWSGEASFALATNEDALENALVDEITPCLANLTLDLGNQLSDRICASAAQGVEEVAVTSRNGSGSMDPEATYESDISWLTDLVSANSVRFRVELGSTAGNKFLWTVPGAVFSSSTTGDREGIMTRDLQFQLTGGNLYNLAGGTPTLKPYGGDNEVVFTFFTGLTAGTN